MTLYNLLFVRPLVAILLVVGDRVTAESLAQWERGHTLHLRLWFGLTKVVMGMLMLIWII